MTDSVAWVTGHDGRMEEKRCTVFAEVECSECGQTVELTAETNGHALSRAAKALGYVEIWTYTLPDEPGTSLRAAGFEFMGWTSHGDNADWNSASKARSAPTCPADKRRWRRRLSDTPPWPRPESAAVDDPQLALPFPEVA